MKNRMEVLLDTGRLISLKIFTSQDFARLTAIHAPFMSHVLQEGKKLEIGHYLPPALPAGAGGGVGDVDALGGELGADLVRGLPVFVFPGFFSFLEAGLDGFVVNGPGRVQDGQDVIQFASRERTAPASWRPSFP